MPSPTPVEVEGELNFFEALKKVAEGKNITSKSWPNGEYGMMRNGKVTLVKGAESFDWIISDGDLEYDDFIVIN